MDRDVNETIGLAPAVTRARSADMKLRLWGLITLGVAVGVIAASFESRSVVDVDLLVSLSVTLIAAEHCDRLFGDGTSVSVSLVVSLASVVVFSRSQWLA